jgi:hypothetical protein
MISKNISKLSIKISLQDSINNSLKGIPHGNQSLKLFLRVIMINYFTVIMNYMGRKMFTSDLTRKVFMTNMLN